MANPVTANVRELIHNAMFRTEPLNVDIPIPTQLFWSDFDADCTCGVPEMCLHADWCGAFGIGARVADDLYVYPRGLFTFTNDEPVNISRAGFFYRWVCSDTKTWHVGGEINGPEHWCERENRMVTQDD